MNYHQSSISTKHSSGCPSTTKKKYSGIKSTSSSPPTLGKNTLTLCPTTSKRNKSAPMSKRKSKSALIWLTNKSRTFLLSWLPKWRCTSQMKRNSNCLSSYSHPLKKHLLQVLLTRMGRCNWSGWVLCLFVWYWCW